MVAPRSGIPRAAIALASLIVLLGGAAVARCEPEDERDAGRESGPQLILPGSHVVRPGQVIELRWEQADAISELEILLSVDGGRHYAVCISPQLDPAQCVYRWQVPRHLAIGTLRMRIRFNRGGREIEGGPAEPLSVAHVDPSIPEPLGLPPLANPGGRAPSPARDRGGIPAGRTGIVPATALKERAPLPEAARIQCARIECTTLSRPPALAGAFAPPRTPPLRT